MLKIVKHQEDVSGVQMAGKTLTQCAGATFFEAQTIRDHRFNQIWIANRRQSHKPYAISEPVGISSSNLEREATLCQLRPAQST